MKSNKNLHDAKRNKDDEFYTQLNDIEKEVKLYEDQLEGKIIFCNCNDKGSQFENFFSTNFDRLKLAGLFIGNGDFRSEENLHLLKQADIVVTNPPFSLFREFMAQLVEHDKKFLVVGSLNAITYKVVFGLIKKNEVQVGKNYARKFLRPGGKIAILSNVVWFTNLKSIHHDKLILTKSYSPESYQKFDNYDAINVDRTKDIPYDYDGAMGVPISFLQKHNQEQFEIVGITNTFCDCELKTKI